MILRGWHVDGFGVWRDHRVEDLAAGLNVLLGPNEIGKSTLHAFVRCVLYGFPDGRSREPAHEPVHGGDHGGRLFLETEEGPLVVERTARNRRAPAILDGAGRRLEPGRLAALLRGADREVFRHVFAFGLAEMAALDALDPERIGQHVFDAGLEGAGRSVTAALEELRARREAELRPRSGRIRELARALKEARAALAEAVERARAHGALLDAEAEAERAGARVEAERRAAEERLRRSELLLRLWPVEARRREAMRACEAEGIDPDAQGDLAARLADLLAARAVRDERAERAAALRRRLAGEEAALREAIAALGPGWSEERLRALDRSAERRARLATHRRSIEQAEHELAAAAAERDRCAREEAQLRAEHDERAARLADAPEVLAAREALRDRRAALGELRAGLAAREEALRRAGRGPSRPAGWSGAAAAAFLLVAVGAFALGAPAAGAVALAAVAAALLLALLLRGGAGEASAAALRDAEARIERARVRLELPAPVTVGDAEVCAVALDEAQRALDARARLEEELDRLRARIAGAAAAKRIADAAVAAAEAEIARRRAAWREEAADLGVDRIDEAIERLLHADRLVERADDLAAQRAERAALEAQVARWDEAAAALAAEAGLGGPTEAALARLAARVDRARALREATAQIEEQLGADERAAALRAELERGERGAWEAARAEAEAAIGRLEAEARGARDRLAEARRARRELEASADVPERAARVARLESELAAAVRRWREAALLERILLETLDRFQRERQPEVFRHASAAFERISLGRWREVRQPLGATGVEVVGRDGRAVEAARLSRGAVDQLYVSVRLGLVRAFADQGLRLPLLLDDVFVNFDPVRAEAAAEVIAGFAASHQVLLFTCHPSTAERMRRADPACRVVDLGAPARAAAGVA